MEGTSPNLSPIKRQSSEVIETNKKFMVYLLVAFNVLIIVRGISAGHLVIKTWKCSQITGILSLHLTNYILWIIVFFGFGWIMHQQRMKHWKLLYIFAIGNLIYKALATLASGFTDDLLGTCFLKVGSKKWFWVLNSLELILFGYCLYKIRKYQNKEERMK